MFGIPFAFLTPPERIKIPSGKTIELHSPSLSPPQLQVEIPEKPSLPYFISSPPETPTIIKPVITFLPISIDVPDLESLTIPSYSPYSGEIPEPTAPDYMEKPEAPSEIDYEKFKFTPFGSNCVYIPFYRKMPTLREIERFVVGEFSFDVKIKENSLEYIEADLLDKFSLSFEAPSFMKTDIFSTLGLKPLPYFEKENSYVKGLISEFLNGLKGFYNLSVLIEKMRAIIESERDKFLKHLSEKERQFFLFRFFSSLFDVKVRMRERWLSTFFDNLSQQLRTIILKNESDFTLKREEWTLREQEATARLNHISRESKNFALLTSLNKDLRGIFTFYNEMSVILTMIEALNIERDRLLVEKMTAMSRIEEARAREDIAQSRKQVLEEREKLYSERVNYLNSEIERLQNVLQSLQKDFEARWAGIKARYSSLLVRADVLGVEADIAQLRGETNILTAYFRGYSDYLDTYLRLNREFLRTYYDTKAYSHRLKADIQRSLMAIHRAGSYYNDYVLPLYDTYYTYCELDRACAWAMANARLSAQIIEAFT